MTRAKDQSTPFRRRSVPQGVFRLEGWAAIADYLRLKPGAIQSLSCSEQKFDDYARRIGEIHPESAAKLQKVAQLKDSQTTIQGEVRVQTSPLRLEAFEKDPKGSVVLALDHITDPRNLGAIVRSAAFLGAHRVIVPTRRQVLLTQVVIDTAQAGFACVQLIEVPNLARALEQLKKKADYWVLGAEATGQPLQTTRLDFEKVVLVLGNEERGIAPNVRKSCDQSIAIPSAARGIESLNVSVAASLILYELLSKRNFLDSHPSL